MVDDVIRNAFGCSFLDMLGLAYGCGQTAQTAVSKFIEQRRARAKTAIKVDPAVLETYVGQYQFDDRLGNRIYNVTREGDHLFIQSTGATGRTEVFAESKTKFFLKTRPWWMQFRIVEGQPPQLDLVQDTNIYTSKRLK
jgi:hypothetical protein